MKKTLVFALFVLLSGCAVNPMGSGCNLIKTPAFDPLFIASFTELPEKIIFKSTVLMYRTKVPAIATLKDSMIITNENLFLSEWQPTTYTFKHKLRIPLSEIKNVNDTTIERTLFPNSQQLQITTKRDEIYNFVILENQASYAKALIENNI